MVMAWIGGIVLGVFLSLLVGLLLLKAIRRTLEEIAGSFFGW